MKFIKIICVSLILFSVSIAQNGTIIINKVTNPSIGGLDFNFKTAPTLMIQSPISVSFIGGSASFGPSLDETGITGTLALVNLFGCNASDFAGFPAGSIAVIDRGGVPQPCPFVDKVMNAQSAGAIGVIIVNNVPTTPAPSLGGINNNITIPTISISYEDGLLVKAEIHLGIVVTMKKELEDFTLQDGTSKTFVDVPAGNYLISEVIQSYESVVLSEIIISDPSGGSNFDLDGRSVFISLSAGETVECTFISDIKVIEELTSQIEDFLASNILNEGQANALLQKLNAAKIKINEGKTNTAINLLNAFINQVNDFISNGILTAEQGQSLIEEADLYISLLNSVLPKSFDAEEESVQGEGSLNNFLLSQNHPNPFNPSTKISWQTPVGSWQTIKVFDALGREVATLADEYRDAGYQEVDFNAADLPSGVYMYRIQAGEYVQTKKMLLLK